MTKKNLVYPYEGYSSSGSDADYEQPTKKYHVDLTSLVVDHRTYEKLNSDKFGYLNGKEFLKKLIDQDVIEIVKGRREANYWDPDCRKYYEAQQKSKKDVKSSKKG